MNSYIPPDYYRTFMRAQRSMRLLLVGFAFFLGVFTAKYFLSPNINYQRGDTTITITYSHLQITGCVDVAWVTNHIQAIYIEGEGTVGVGEGTFCHYPYGPIVSVTLPDGNTINYSREDLWQTMTTSLWLAGLCLAVAWFWPQHWSILITGSCIFLGLMIWGHYGTVSLPLISWLSSFAALSPLLQLLSLVILVPLFYWNTIRFSERTSFLLGVGILTFTWYGATYEYLLLLGVIIVWISRLWLKPTAIRQITPLEQMVCGLLLVAFTMAVVASTHPNASLPLIERSIIYGLVVGVLGLGIWWTYCRVIPFVIIKGFVGLGLVLYLFNGHLLPEIFDQIASLSSLRLMISIAALLLIGLALRFGQYFNAVQRQYWVSGGIILLLGLFMCLKHPQGQLIGWVGFSYAAFRLLHVLLEHRQKTALPQVTPTQLGLYVTFFPAQLVGPIDLLPHFASYMQTEPIFLWNDYVEGWRRVLWGVIKKFFIADVLLSVLIPGTVPIKLLTPSAAWIQLYVYAFYLYCDFSGYVDVAIGLALMLGYRLPENFKQPYTKGNLAQFWQSWHITLSNWIRTYVYLPLSRRLLRTRLRYSSLSIVFIANLVTMGLIGLWHGFTWNFLLWGLWHAIGLFLHKVFSDRTRQRQIKWRGTSRARLFHILSVTITFHYVLLGWVFFSFSSLNQSLDFFRKLAGLH